MNVVGEDVPGPRTSWFGPMSLIACPVLLIAYLVFYHGLHPLVGAKAAGALYFLCFVPGYVLQRGLFRLKGLSPFETMVSSLLLGLLLTPLVWTVLCCLGLSAIFFPLVIVLGLAVPVFRRWHHRILRQPGGLAQVVAPADAPILWLALAIGMLWSYSISVVEIRDGQAYIIPYCDHTWHAAMAGEYARGVPAQAVPCIVGAKKWAYHYMPHVWCDMMRRATGADLQSAFFHIALTFRYPFVCLACYLALVRRFGRGAALTGVVFTFAVVGYVGHQGGVLLTNGLPRYLYENYPCAFGLVGVFLILYYVSVMKSDGPRVPLLLASVLSAVLLWYKANFALAVAPAVAVLSLVVLGKQRDYRWLLLCWGVQGLATGLRCWELATSDVRVPLIAQPLGFLTWWWDSLAAPEGWPAAALTAVRQAVDSLPVLVRWPAVLAVCFIHMFHISLVTLPYLLLRRRGGTTRFPINRADLLTLLILLFICAVWLISPQHREFAWIACFPLWFLVYALLFSLTGTLVYALVRRAMHSGKAVAVTTSAVLLFACVVNAQELRLRAVWQTRYRSDVISADLYDCYRYINTSTPLDSVILDPRCQERTTAGMLTERRMVLEREPNFHWQYNTAPILADVKQFYGKTDAQTARAILDRYGVDYVVADLSTGWEPPNPPLLSPVFRRGDAAVFLVRSDRR